MADLTPPSSQPPSQSTTPGQAAHTAVSAAPPSPPSQDLPSTIPAQSSGNMTQQPPIVDPVIAPPSPPAIFSGEPQTEVPSRVITGTPAGPSGSQIPPVGGTISPPDVEGIQLDTSPSGENWDEDTEEDLLDDDEDDEDGAMNDVDMVEEVKEGGVEEVLEKGKGKGKESANSRAATTGRRGKGRGGKGGGRGGGGLSGREAELYEADIVARWNKEIGDVCLVAPPQTS